MKALFLLFSTFFFAAHLYANDTLTRAQVYNFSVGDTFDYRRIYTSNLGAPYANTTYFFSRVVITNVEYSLNNDTIIICRYLLPEAIADTLVLADLQHYEYYVSRDSVCQQNYCQIDSSSIYNERLVNYATNGNCWEHYSEAKFAEGLGKVYGYYNCGDHPPDPGCEGRTELIYYSKGSEKWGTPYYVKNGGSLLQFTPLPEECAIWTSQLGNIKEQIKTGNRIEWQGHAYVEMIYSNINSQNGVYRADSLIGYFRNDTVNQMVLFYKQVNSASFFDYDFKQLVDGYCTSVDQISVDGNLSTRWKYSSFGIWKPYFTSAQLYYVQGIGGLNGLIPMEKDIVVSQYAIVNFAELTSFCVCGQAIYPNSSASCALLSDVNEVSRQYPTFTLSPNPAGSSVVITLEGNTVATVASNLSITDLAGRTLISLHLPASTYTLSTETLPEGSFFVTISNEAQSETRKLVIGR